MKSGVRILSFFFVTLLFGQAFGQNTYLVYLKDKTGTPFSLDKPEQFLSERALDRRHKQGIAIDSTDLPVCRKYVDSLSRYANVHVVSKWLNGVAVECNEESKRELLNLPFVDGIRPVKTETLAFSESSFLNKNKHFEKYYEVEEYGEAQVQNQLIDADFLHQNGYMGQGMHVAIFDGGFFQVNKLENFEYLRTNNRIIETYDFVGRDTMVFDQGYHGMQVLSTMGSFVPNRYIGTAPEASFYLYRTEDGDSESQLEEVNWLAAAERADSIGVDVINSSLGYSDFDDDFMDYTHQMLDGASAISSIAADIAASKGIVVVVSAGNSGDEEWERITPPADAKNVLAVGATSSDGQLTAFSSIGPTADGRIKPDVTAMGQMVAVQHEKGGISYSNGTSFAAPTLCGSVACLWQAFPEKTNLEIIEAVRISGERYLDPELREGYGLASFERAYDFLRLKIMHDAQNTVFVFPRAFSSKASVFFPNETEMQDETEIILIDAFGNLFDFKDEMSVYENQGGKIFFEKTFLHAGVFEVAFKSKGEYIQGYFVILP